MTSLMKKPLRPDVHVWLVFIKAAQAITRLVTADRQAPELCESDFRVLEVLLHKGALPVNTIGPKVGLTPGAISVAVDRLHARELVSRVEDTDDRRCRMVDLTPAGRAVIVPAFRRHEALIRKVVSVLSPQEREQLEVLLKKIGRQAEALASQD